MKTKIENKHHMKPTSSCTVVGAVIADLPELMRLFRIMWAEGGMFPLDEDCAKEMFVNAIEKHQGVIGVIRGDGTEVRAFICLLITRFWYTSKFHLEELWSYVGQEHRRTNYSEALIRYAKHCSDDLKIPLMIGVLSNKRMEAKVRLYQKHFGVPFGAFFLHGQNWITAPTDREAWKGLSGHRRITVPKDTRFIPKETLKQLGDGNADRGWTVVQKFIDRQLAKTTGMLNGDGVVSTPQIPSLLEMVPATTTVM